MVRLLLMTLVAVTLLGDILYAQGGPGRGRGFQGGRGLGAGGRHDDRHEADQQVFHELLSNHQQIRRTVKELPNGVETLTESDVPGVAAKIQEHVQWMEVRVRESQPIRMRDPLFAEIFRHAEKIEFQYENTEKGVRVTETSKDPYVAKLIQAHAKVVSGFVERGFAEARKNHSIPDGNDATPPLLTPINPIIPNHGSVVRLPKAAHQPRQGTKILIDITAGNEPEELNKAIEKVAKYVNIYAGGGAVPAQGQFAVVFHGDATLAVLNDESYTKRFQTPKNPNLDLLHQIHENGVELFVCGQSLISKDAKPEEVAVFVDTAVSALTVVANLHADGYAHIQLNK